MNSLSLRIPKSSLEQIVSEICLYLFEIITILLQIQEGNILFFRVRLIVMIVGACIGVYYCINKSFYKPIVFAIVSIILWLFCFLIQTNPNSDFEKIQYTVLYIGLAILLIAKFDSLVVSRIVLISLFAYMFYQMIIGQSFRNIIVSGSSYNYISVVLLFALLFYYIASLNRKKDISLLVAILYFFLCNWAYGRGGIVASAFLCISLIIKKIISEENHWKKRLYILLAFVIVVFAIIMLQRGSLVQTFFLKFTLKGASDAARVNIWTTFLQNNNKSIITFLFGSDVSVIRSDHNLHNFALQAYASFGLLGFLLLVIVIIRSMILMIKLKKYEHLILFLFLLIRASTDRVFFQGYSEIFLYYFILFPFFEFVKTKNSMQIENKSAEVII